MTTTITLMIITAMKGITMDDFVLYALAAGLMIAVIAGIMGCFIVWRRMAYFGDSLAHSALLGIALGLISSISTTAAILGMSALFSGLLLWMQQRRVMSTDALLGILAHGALSTAIVIMAFAQLPVDLHSLLFGDILTVTTQDLTVIGIGGIIVISLISFLWQPLLLMTINEDLAKAEGVNTLFLQVVFLFLIAITVAISVRMVGVLLITSMLIIPASTARQFAPTPIVMAILSAGTGMLAVACGMGFSLEYNTPTGPSMVLCLAILFTLSLVITRLIAPLKAHILK